MHLQQVTKFIEATVDEEINDTLTLENNPQKSQPEVKRRRDIATTEITVSKYHRNSW